MNKSFFTVKHITRISILAAISAVLLMINFPIPFFPSFYKIDFSDIPCLLCGFALGPASGVICTILSKFLNLIIEGGSETAYIGELASLLISISFVFSSSIIYRKEHTKKGAVISLIVAIIVSGLLSAIVNYLILLPMYETLMNISIDSIIASISNIFTLVKSKLSFVLLCTLPFNIIKGIINSLITILIYKRISPLIKDIY